MVAETSNTEGNSSSSADTEWWENVAESCVRVSFAGFSGALIGLAKEQQQQQQPLAQEKITRPMRKAPPRAFKKPLTNLPISWSMGCMTFVMILETTHKASPTSMLLNDYAQGHYPVSIKLNIPGDTELHRAMATCIGDYTIGGTVTGIAGALAQQRRRQRQPALSLWSLTVSGLCLGVLAGVMQGGVDVGSILLEREMEQEESKETS